MWTLPFGPSKKIKQGQHALFGKKSLYLHNQTTLTTMRPFSHILLFFAALMAPLTLWGQAAVRFHDVVLSLGDLHWKVPTAVRFQLSNVGTEPLTIETVQPDCGCTHATWPQQPIAPGESATITAHFDAQTLGSFQKMISVKTNADAQPQYLSFKGRVVAEVHDVDKDFPYAIGDIRLSTDNIEFDDIERGQLQEKLIYVYNGSKQDYMPQLLHLPKYLSAYAEPEVLRPGRVGRLRLTLNSQELHTMGLTQTSIYLARYPGDKVGRDTEIGLSATLLPPHVEDAALLHQAPALLMDSLIHLGSFGSKKKLKGELWLTNAGHSLLTISALQVYNPGISVQLDKRSLKPGERTRLRLVAHKDLDLFKGSHRLLLISNDPRQPKRVVQVLMKR